MKAGLAPLVVGLFVLVGCGGQTRGSDSPASGSSIATSASSTPTAATATSSAPAVSQAEAEKTSLSGLMPDSAMAKIDFKAKEKREAGGWEWYQSCTKILPSNPRIIGGARARWSDGKRTVSQIVDVYPPGVAEQAVAEAKKRTTCANYALSDGTEVSGVKAFPLQPVAGVTAQHAWCETIKTVSRCHVVLAVDDTLSSVWVLSDPVADTQKATAAFAKLAGARLVVQQK